LPEVPWAVGSALGHGSCGLGLSAIVGSAIFNVLVIPAASALYAERDLDSTHELVYKEGLFYMLAVAILMVTFCLAVIYFPVEGKPMHGTMTRGLMIAPVTLYALYLLMQFLDGVEYEPEEPFAKDEVSAAREWLRMAWSLVLILGGVGLLVQAALGLGDLLDTPDFFWGVTVVAAGTSIPDAFVSARAAKHDNSETSLANVLGSNTFDLCIALPAGVLIAGSAVLDLNSAVPMMGALTVATVVLFTMLRTRLKLTQRESIVLLVLYAAFVVWMALLGFGVIPAPAMG